MSENTKRSLKIYRTIGKAGAIILFLGCFLPVQTEQHTSIVQNFFGGMAQLSQGYTNAGLLEVILCFALLVVASQCLMTILSGQVERLRATGIQAWVILLITYSHYFGVVIPLHYGADWGWTVLFLGATLVTFGAFRANSELAEIDESESQDRTHGPRSGTRKKK